MKNSERISKDPAAAYNPEAFLKTPLVVDFSLGLKNAWL